MEVVPSESLKELNNSQKLKENDNELEYIPDTEPAAAGEFSKEIKKKLYIGKELPLGNISKLENELKRLRLENQHLKTEKKLLLQDVNKTKETELSNNEDKDISEKESSPSDN